MTDLERLEEAWPLGWVPAEDCADGYDAVVGDAVLEVLVEGDVWTFWFLDESLGEDEIGRGDLPSASARAARFLSGRRDDAARKAEALSLAIGRFDRSVERSEA